MAKQPDVIKRIRQWAVELGGEQLQRLGYAAIEAIRSTPAANDPVYSVDAACITRIIERMQADGMEKQAKVLRVHYLTPGLSEGERLSRLRREGLSISRAAYYIYLDAAHAYVAGALPGEDACES